MHGVSELRRVRAFGADGGWCRDQLRHSVRHSVRCEPNDFAVFRKLVTVLVELQHAVESIAPLGPPDLFVERFATVIEMKAAVVPRMVLALAR